MRTKSAHVRGPAPGPALASASSTDVDGDTTLTPVEPILSEEKVDHIGKSREETDGAERSEGQEEGGKNGEDIRVSEADDDDDEEELTQVEELKVDQLLAASGEIENDSSFHKNKDEMF